MMTLVVYIGDLVIGVDTWNADQVIVKLLIRRSHFLVELVRLTIETRAVVAALIGRHSKNSFSISSSQS